MNTFRIYSDADCSIDAGSVLVEGRTYFCEFPTSDPQLIRSALAEAGLEQFVTWHKRNKVATLRIVNRIGLFTLWDKLFDVRSEKLLEAESGARQFQIILDDLSALSRQILFENSAAPSAMRKHRADASTPSVLERFNYYRQTCLPARARTGLAKTIEQILRNPHHRLVASHVQDHVWTIRRPSRKTMLSLLQQDQTFIKLPADHPLVAGRTGLVGADNTHGYFPLKALRNKGEVTYDTPENRFIKHVLMDIESVCRAVLRNQMVSGVLLEQCANLSRLAKSLLLRDFFAEIGALDSVPYASPTLSVRAGYRDLYRMFVRSRVGAKHLFEDFAEESLFIELKDVALLYEYWVFYKVAATLLKDGLYEHREAIVRNGRIVNSAVVSDDKYRIHFNKTFTRRPDGSYSAQLRPDIVVERLATETAPKALFVLDAKYKSSERSQDDDESLESIRVVQVSDLHKMHCYADAIEGVVAAVAVFPGSEFLFYGRDRTTKPLTAAEHMLNLRGVGAVPLVPGVPATEFEKFVTGV